MTSSTSTYRYIFKSVLILPFFAILGLTFGCEPASLEEGTQPQKVHIEILSSETIKLNGETIALSQFASAYSDLSLDPNQVVVYLTVYDNASVGTVTDVQTILREQGTLKINYSNDSSIDSIQEFDLKQIGLKFQDATSKYFKMELAESNLNSLKEQYDIVMKWHRALTKAQEINSSSSISPPPPPIPLSPEIRIKNRP